MTPQRPSSLSDLTVIPVEGLQPNDVLFATDGQPQGADSFYNELVWKLKQPDRECWRVLACRTDDHDPDVLHFVLETLDEGRPPVSRCSTMATRGTLAAILTRGKSS